MGCAPELRRRHALLSIARPWGSRIAAAHNAWTPTFGLAQQRPHEELDALNNEDGAAPAQIQSRHQPGQRQERQLHRNAAHALPTLAGGQSAPRQQGGSLSGRVQRKPAGQRTEFQQTKAQTVM